MSPAVGGADEKGGTGLAGGRLLSVADLATYLGVKPQWIYNNHRSLGIPARKIGGHLRFRLTDVDRWIDQQEVSR